MSDKEFIICAAIWVDDKVQYVHQPTDTGIVFAGWRHFTIFAAIEKAYKDERLRAGEHQGFLTSTGKFVNREEAFEIATKSEQLKGHIHCPGHLFSEDLY